MVEKGTISTRLCKIPSVVKLQKEMTRTLCMWLYSGTACEQKHTIMYVVRIVCVSVRTSSPVICLKSLYSQVAVVLFLCSALFSLFIACFFGNGSEWMRWRICFSSCRSPSESLSYIWVNGLKWSFYLNHDVFPKCFAALYVTSLDFLRP